MVYPEFIRPGALVGLIAPSGKIAERWLKEAEQFLDRLGMRHLRGRHATGAWHQFGGTDAQRAADLNAMLLHPEVEVIWCLRGGYGAVRLLDMVDWRPLIEKPKWLVGFSDITVLHAQLLQLGMGSVHGPMPKNFGDGASAATGMNELWDLLQGELPVYELPVHPLNRPGKGTGRLAGGNLTILSMLKGSELDFEPRGTVLFLEEVGEQLYHIDRMMQGLKIAGKLKGLAGLVVGQMTELMDGNTPFGFTAYEIIAEAVKDYSFPVLYDFPAGHAPLNRPLLMGHKVRLKLQSELAVLEYVS